MSRHALLTALAVLLPTTLPLLAAGGGHADEPSDPLLGQFVGMAHDVDLDGGQTIDREIDIVIGSHDNGGLTVHWTNVTLVDGKRDVPGVKRRSDDLRLAPAPDRQFFLAGSGYDPFQDRRSLDPLKGDPLRWGARDGDQLAAYSFQILDDGRYELQVYRRDLAADGGSLDLAFQRILDGTVTREMTGHAVRAE